jgi:hypothetical protein
LYAEVVHNLVKVDKTSSYTVKSDNLIKIIISLIQQQNENLLCQKKNSGLELIKMRSVLANKAPLIEIDTGLIYKKLMESGIINKKLKPSAKIDLVKMPDYIIVNYFRKIMEGLLDYFCCVDNITKIKSIIN